jgi:uncharacterized RDD family membrane protein YckC/cytoskeletal protein CcmA (bactofilin family)
MKSKLPFPSLVFWLAMVWASLPNPGIAEGKADRPGTPPAPSVAAVEPAATAEKSAPPEVPKVPDSAAPVAEGKLEKSEKENVTPATVAEDKERAKEEPEKSEKETKVVPIKRASRHSPRDWAQGDWSYHAPEGSELNFMGNVEIAADKTVEGDALAIIGNTSVEGAVKHDAVALLGDITINGMVRHNVVAVLGDVTLGPKARVEGDVVSVGGEVHRDAGTFVGGVVRIDKVDKEIAGLRSWWAHALRFGRPLAVAAHLGWLWIMLAFSVAFYALLGLLFPKAIRNCGNNLVQHPGQTLLATVLGILALPVVFVLLCITIIGIPVALLVLPLLLVLAVLFGKASLYALTGRAIAGDRLHPALAIVLGASIFVLLYLVPVVGLLLSLLAAMIGFGCVVLSLINPAQKPLPPSAGGGMPASTSAMAGGSAVPPLFGETPVPATPASMALPTVISAFTMSRAGFWIRFGATLLDLILVGMLVGMSEKMLGRWFNPDDAFPLWFALYHVVMWNYKGTTIGGIICGLKVVRIDDRPLDWSVALVRGLSAFLSLAVVGLGFIWVAFDDDKQSWHDKIAGTTIVKVPKGMPLL